MTRNRVRRVLAGCERRQDGRHFRIDRIDLAVPSGARYPGRRDERIQQ